MAIRRERTRIADPSRVIDVDFDLRRMDATPIEVIGCRRLAGTEVTHPAIPSAMAAPSALGTLTGKKAPIVRGRGCFIFRRPKATHSREIIEIATP
jgi:hypothetical protein